MVGMLEGRIAVAVRREWVAESHLVRAGLAGDRAALEALLAPHQQPLYTLCRGILGSSDDAEDAVQETFLRALRALPRFREEARVQTWLCRIAVNVCLEWKRGRRPTASLDEMTAPTPSTLVQAPDAVALRNLGLMEALQELPVRQRAVLLLKELEGWSVAEIGAALGCTAKRVENDLYRARRALLAWRRRAEADAP